MKVWRVDKWVEWIEAALEIAQQLERKTSMELRFIKRKLKEAKETHDDFLLKYGINSLRTKTENFARAPDSQPASPLFTAIHPYDEELEEIPTYKKYMKKYKKEVKISQLFENIRYDDHKDGRFMDKSFYRMRTTMMKYSRKLCNGDTSLRPPRMDTNLRCHHLHYHNPYLQLGPFKYEPLNEDPHIGMFRDFYSSQHLDNLVTASKDKLFSSTYHVRCFKNYIFAS